MLQAAFDYEKSIVDPSKAWKAKSELVLKGFSFVVYIVQNVSKNRQASGHWRVQIPLYLFPHALLFLSCFFCLSAPRFLLLTRFCCTFATALVIAPGAMPPKVHHWGSGLWDRFGSKLHLGPIFPIFWRFWTVPNFNTVFGWHLFLHLTLFYPMTGSHFDVIFALFTCFGLHHYFHNNL